MEPAWIGVLGTLSGTILGGFIGIFSAAKINKRQEFNKAAFEFRDAFLPERRILDIRHAPESTDGKSAFEILEPALERHTEAMLRFKHFLSSWDRYYFTRAWNKYAHYKVKGEPDTPFLAMYYEEKWEGKDTKQLAIDRIDNLLKFAKHK